MKLQFAYYTQALRLSVLAILLSLAALVVSEALVRRATARIKGHDA